MTRLKLDDSGYSENDASSMCRSLELMVADHYDVYPVDSQKAFEEAVDDNGVRYRASHVSFAAPWGNDVPIKIFEGIMEAFPPGSTVIWRRRPTITTQNGVPAMTCRIGCFQS